MEIKLSVDKWTRIFSCYKDAFMNNVYLLQKQTLEYELYYSKVNAKPCIISCKFQFNCIQPNANNGTTMLTKMNKESDFQCCYNVTKDNKNRKIVNVYAKCNEDINTCYLVVTKSPNINLFRFYSSEIPVDTVEGIKYADVYNPVINKTFNYTDDNSNTYEIKIKRNNYNVWYKVLLTYGNVGGFSLNINGDDIPEEFRPSETVYTQRIIGISDNTLISTSLTFNNDGAITISSNANNTHSLIGNFIK